MAMQKLRVCGPGPKVNFGASVIHKKLSTMWKRPWKTFMKRGPIRPVKDIYEVM
jgi:hypothetical protein